jgi:DNA-binding NarL/FixJ family response regulator
MFTVVGEAEDGAAAIDLAWRLQPDIVVLDIGLPDFAGHHVLTGIREASPGARVVVYSGTDPDDTDELAGQVDGYAIKDGRLEYLVELLETVARRYTERESTHLEASLDSARRGREFTRTTLQNWGVENVADDAMLVVSELISNAVTHGRGLYLIDAVAGAWGVEPVSGGKLVWAEISRRP